MREATGVDFSQYKKSTIERRLVRRMVVCDTESLNTYLRTLETLPPEREALFDQFLIPVTEFFRDPEVFQRLSCEVFPRVLAAKPPYEALRLWVAGCSTGEEAYSIAISLLECPAARRSGRQIQIFCTDVSQKALEKARTGIYSAEEVKQIPPELLRRWFTPVSEGFQVNSALRELCLFARHDLISDPPFSRIDLISCRNVLIYMEEALQKRILESFQYGLRPNGLLLLGKSENPAGVDSTMFVPTDVGNKFFRKSENAPAILISAPAPPALLRTEEQRSPAPPKTDPAAEATKFVWERYSHAGLVVNREFQIIHFLGDTSPYLKHSPGRASLRLSRILRREIFLDVRAAVQKAIQGEPAAKSAGTEIQIDGRTRNVTVEVQALQSNGPERFFLILFEQAENAEPAPDPEHSDKEIQRLREQLAGTRQYANDFIRNQFASNEELKASHAEALSSVEELKSANEELETAKEELQSSNEELVTLNSQLQKQNAELARVSADLGSVLNGVDIPIVILGVDRRIRRFTPPAEKLLGLIEADIGRPFARVRTSVEIPDCDERIAAAVRDGQNSGVEVMAKSGIWYSVRLRPFVTEDGDVPGVLVAFIDIDDTKKIQQDLEQRARQFETQATETLVDELAILNRLHRTSEYLWRSHSLKEGLELLLSDGIEVMKADMGNIQLLNEEKQALEIVVQRGFSRDFLEHFAEVRADDGSACGRSLRSGWPIVIEDVATDVEFARHQVQAVAAGFRSVVSAPLRGDEGKMIGMFSAHFRAPHRPSEVDLSRLDLFARRAAQFIERRRIDSRLERLTRALLTAQEDGNRAIARELHDTYSQELVVLNQEVWSIKNDFPVQRELSRRLSQLGRQIQNITENLHKTARNLHPTVLDELGLATALRQQCNDFRDETGLPTEFRAVGMPDTLPAHAGLALYRTAQEALLNIRQHAGKTKRVKMWLKGDDTGITLTVSDQGKGIDAQAAVKKSGLGLVSVSERLRAVHGKLKIESRAGRGTTVTAFVPTAQNEPENPPQNRWSE